MNENPKKQPKHTVGLEPANSLDLLNGIRSDIQAVLDAKSGLDLAIDCLRAGMDDRFLDEIQKVARAYLDSERGRLFALRNGIPRRHSKGRTGI
jgi:hypothetical protein